MTVHKGSRDYPVCGCVNEWTGNRWICIERCALHDPWAELCVAASRLGAALALFENAKDTYVVSRRAALSSVSDPDTGREK